MTYASLIVLGVLWLGALLGGLLPILGTTRTPLRRFWFRSGSAIGAMGVGAVGLWMPFSLWPDLAYTWTHGSFSIEISLSWFFVAPLLLGAIALVLVIRSRLKPRPKPPEVK
jgi:hypothetical protein